LPLWAIPTKCASELKELLASLRLFFLLAAENVKPAVHLYPEWQQLPRSQTQWEYEWTQNHKCLKHSYEIPVSKLVHQNHLFTCTQLLSSSDGSFVPVSNVAKRMLLFLECSTVISAEQAIWQDNAESHE